MRNTVAKVTTVLVVVALVLGIVGYRSVPYILRPSTGDGAVMSDAKSDSTASREVADDDANSFATKFAEAINAADTDRANQLFDWDEAVRRATQGSPISEAIKRGFARGYKGKGTIIQRITDVIEQGGRYRLLRTGSTAEERRLTFRLSLPHGGINYHVVSLYRDAEGQVMAADIYVMAIGEWISETIRNLLIDVAAQEDRKILARLPRNDIDRVSYAWRTDDFRRNVQAGSYKHALDGFGQLPLSLQRDKSLLILRMTAAQQGSDVEYTAALADMNRYHPDDPCLALAIIDSARLEGDFPSAMEAVNDVDRAVGGDPYLDLMRATILREQQDFDNSQALLDKVEAWDPSFVETQWSYVELSLKQRDFTDTVKRLNKLELELGVTLYDVALDPRYAEFVRSPEYEAWSKSRSRKNAGLRK